MRHAEPARIEQSEGPADPPLTDVGRAKAHCTARWLSRTPIGHVVTSPLRRARETAQPLAELLGLEPETVAGVGEFDARDTSYIPFEELRANRDERWQAMVEGRWHEVPSWTDPATFARQVVDAMEDIISRFPAQRVAVFSHGGVLNVYLASVLGLDRWGFFYPEYASISRVAASRNGERSVVSINETAHLELLSDGGPR